MSGSVPSVAARGGGGGRHRRREGYEERRKASRREEVRGPRALSQPLLPGLSLPRALRSLSLRRGASEGFRRPVPRGSAATYPWGSFPRRGIEGCRAAGDGGRAYGLSGRQGRRVKGRERGDGPGLDASPPLSGVAITLGASAGKGRGGSPSVTRPDPAPAPSPPLRRRDPTPGPPRPLGLRRGARGPREARGGRRGGGRAPLSFARPSARRPYAGAAPLDSPRPTGEPRLRRVYTPVEPTD